MIIHKNIHSCIVVEDQKKIILIDPGRYGYDESPLDLDKISTLDYLLITHHHSDHMYIPFIKKIISKFSNVKVISNIEISDRLDKESIDVSFEGNKFVGLETLKHERSFDKNVPLNTIFTLFNRFTHSGDNLQYPNRTEIMTLPIDCGTWGNVTLAIERLVKIKPKIILPIHDFRIKDEIRSDIYKRIQEYFKSFDITFLPMLPGDSISI